MTRYIPLDTGPNTVSGHTSVIFSKESQVTYLLQLLEPVRAGVLTSVAPTDAATDRYNDMLQERLKDSVWSQCASWYRVGGSGRIASTFPGPLVLLWWWLRRLRWEVHEIEGPGAEEWRRRHARWSCMRLVAIITLSCAFGALLSAVLHWNAELGLSNRGCVFDSFLRRRSCHRADRASEVLALRRKVFSEIFGRLLERLPTWVTGSSQSWRQILPI